MKNPLQDEGAAFRVVLGAVVFFALVALGSWIDRWLGLGVFLALSAALLVWLRGGRREPPSPIEIASAPGEYRVLVVANETVGAPGLRRTVLERASRPKASVFVLCPALNSRLRTWTSDEDGAREQAQSRLDETLAGLRELGVAATGAVGDGDPVQAVEDALHSFPADEIIVSTHPPGSSNWLERGVVEKLRARVSVPVTHLVTDGSTVLAAQPPAAVET